MNQKTPPHPVDTWATDNIICPYCGYEDEESWEYDDYQEIECEECGEIFDCERSTSVCYTTWRKDE